MGSRRRFKDTVQLLTEGSPFHVAWRFQVEAVTSKQAPCGVARLLSPRSRMATTPFIENHDAGIRAKTGKVKLRGLTRPLFLFTRLPYSIVVALGQKSVYGKLCNRSRHLTQRKPLISELVNV